MPKLKWDESTKRLYETGVEKVALYPKSADATYPAGVAWNGITAVTESPSGAEATPLYANNKKYLSLVSAEESSGTIEAYTYPEEFEACDGNGSLVTGVSITQQSRKEFGLAYQTAIGNDADGDSHGYKLHLLYGAVATPSEKKYSTISNSPEAMTMSWKYTATPVDVEDFKPTALLIIDSTKVDTNKLEALEEILYGRDAVSGETSVEALVPRLPLPDEIKTLLT